MARYYAELQPDPKLADAYLNMDRIIKLYRAKGMTAETARAQLAFRSMVRDYELLSRRGARQADEMVRAHIRATAVRPQTSGRLEQAVHSEPLPSVLPGGGVGIAAIHTLDTIAVNPRYKRSGEYWRAQEYGTDAHVGRIIPGYFMPGRSIPDASQFRNHPYFQQAGRNANGKAARGTPAMLIRRPIEARHFLGDGAREFAVWHERESLRINNAAISHLR